MCPTLSDSLYKVFLCHLKRLSLKHIDTHSMIFDETTDQFVMNNFKVENILNFH